MKVYVEKEPGDYSGALSEVLQAIKGRPPQVKVFIISAGDHDWELLMSANLDGLVRKNDRPE